jgi:hypothetical protein
VRKRNLTRILAVPAALALGLSMFTVSLTFQVPTVQAAAINNQARELVRMMNGVRAAQGKGPLVINLFLESKARDGAIPCPDDAAKTIAGRAADFSNYPANSDLHKLRLCDTAGVSALTFVSTMQTAWGYGSVGEIIGVNGGYGNAANLYQDVVGGRVLWQTWTYNTTSHMMAGWQSSSTHWNIIMGSYDNVGCGGWAVGSTYFYDCAFARGGPSPLGNVYAPTASPYPGNPLPPIATPRPPAPPPAKTAAPATADPAAPAYTSAPTPADGMDSAPLTVADASATPTATPTPTPTASPTSQPIIAALSHADATGSTTKQRPAALSEGDLMTPSTPVPTSIARTVALVGGTGAGLLSACLALLSMRRRRRQIAD